MRRNEQEPVESRLTLTRRDFLKGLTGAGANLVLLPATFDGIQRIGGSDNANNSASERTKLQNSSNQLTKNVYAETMMSSVEKDPTLIDTSKEAALLLGAEVAVFPIVKALKLPIGNPSLSRKDSEKILRMPYLKILLLFAGLIPSIEETIFRGIPSFLIGGKRGQDEWPAGLLSTAVFAIVHNLKEDETSGKTVFDKGRIPLYQFISGLFYWKTIRERGLSHSIVAHGTINGLVLGVSKFFFDRKESRINPQSSRKFIGKH